MAHTTHTAIIDGTPTLGELRLWLEALTPDYFDSDAPVELSDEKLQVTSEWEI